MAAAQANTRPAWLDEDPAETFFALDQLTMRCTAEDPVDGEFYVRLPLSVHVYAKRGHEFGRLVHVGSMTHVGVSVSLWVSSSGAFYTMVQRPT